MSANTHTVPVLVEVVGKCGGSIGVAEISVSTLRANLRSATSLLAEALADIQEVGKYKLSELEVSVEITAEGGIQFVGTTKVSGSGAITLKFTKS